MRTRLVIATLGPILWIIVLAFTDNVGVRYNDMTGLKNLMIVPIVLGGLAVALFLGFCFALPSRGQPFYALAGGVLSTATFGLAFFLSRQV